MASIGAAFFAPSPATSARSASARDSARSPCRSRTTPSCPTRYNGRSLRRKLVELRITRLLEHELTKDQILEHYLNVIYLGNGVNGVEAASRDLFGKSVEQLTIAEGAMLAALPKAPSSYSPRHDPRQGASRVAISSSASCRSRVTSSSATADKAKDEPLRIAAEEWRPALVDEPSAMDAVRARRRLRHAGCAEGRRRHRRDDARLHRCSTPPTVTCVRQASAITRETRDTYGHVSEPAQGAYVALDPGTGDIRALVTGHRTQRGQFDRAISAHRQPGSAFKPFVYAAAMRAGYAPSTLVDDEPVEVDIGKTVWMSRQLQRRLPRHRDDAPGAHQLSTTPRRSASAATVGEPAIILAARNNGIVSHLDPVPSIALGAEEVTPLELVTAYAAFDNGGFRVRPRLVTRILAPDGTVLREFEGAREDAGHGPA